MIILINSYIQLYLHLFSTKYKCYNFAYDFIKTLQQPSESKLYVFRKHVL